MTELSNNFWALVTSGRVVKSSIKVSLIVGTVLALINHGPAIVQILLTYLVPYSVSTYSAVQGIQNQMSLGD